MLGDILHFAAVFLVDDGRVSIWMPTANDEEVELGIPQHEALELVSSAIQVFNKCTVESRSFGESLADGWQGPGGCLHIAESQVSRSRPLTQGRHRLRMELLPMSSTTSESG